MVTSTEKNFKWYFLVALFLANVLVWYAIFTEERNGILTVAFLDVGQGDAIFIEAPNGNQMLIDGGPNQAVLKALGDVMPYYDRSIDIVLATHPDKDHIGGLPGVLERYDVSFFVDPGAKAETGVYEALMEAVFMEGGEYVLARRGTNLFLDDDVYLSILFPDREVAGMKPNDASIIARLTYGEVDFLLSGDAPKKIEEFVANLDANHLNVEVMKIGHHGSKTSTSELFVGLASPLFAVISLGKDNSYGHPHKEVLDTLSRFRIPTLRTDEEGTIIFKSDGEKISILK